MALDTYFVRVDQARVECVVQQWGCRTVEIPTDESGGIEIAAIEELVDYGWDYVEWEVHHLFFQNLERC